MKQTVPVLGAYNLAYEFKRIYIPKLLLVAVISLAFSLLIKLLGVVPLGFPQIVVTSFFWTAAFFVTVFKRHPFRGLFWLLMLEMGIALYQVAIYSAVLDGYVLLRVGPILLGGALYLFSARRTIKMNNYIYFFWVILNFPCLFFVLITNFKNPYDAVLYWIISVIYPLIFYYAASNMQLTCGKAYRDVLGDAISVGVLLLSVVPVVLIPMELSARDTDSMAALQFGGRAYSVIGIVILLCPLLIASISRWNLIARYGAGVIFLLLFASSFSRGAMTVVAMLLLGLFLLRRRQVKNGFVFILTILFVFLLFVQIYNPKIFTEAAWFWLIRLNFADNISGAVGIDSSAFLETGRENIWEYAVMIFERSPLFGHGIGSAPILLGEVSNGQMAFGSMHGLILTLLAERGLMGLGAAGLLFGRCFYLIIISKNDQIPRKFMFYALCAFLVFANGTGVELFLNSTRSLNATVTVSLFLLLSYLEGNASETKRKPVFNELIKSNYEQLK